MKPQIQKNVGFELGLYGSEESECKPLIALAAQRLAKKELSKERFHAKFSRALVCTAQQLI